MVNVYFLSDGAAPAGYSEIDVGYRDRYVKLGATPLSTGGASTHVHTGSATHNANTDLNSRTHSFYLNSVVNGNTHTHSGTTLNTIGSSSNFAAYRTIRCHYRSTSGWDGHVPAGLIAFSESVPASGWERFWNGQSEFIMISGTYNSTGGGTHSHSVAGSLANTQLAGMLGSTTNVTSTAVSLHGHTYSSTITGSAYDYYYWSCGLVRSNTVTIVFKDMYVLFDGDPGDGWADTGVSSRYLKCSPTNAVATGGAYTSTSHTHTGSVDSSTSNSCINSASNTSYNDTVLCSHVHQVNISLYSAAAEPSWVGLSLYKATKNFASNNLSRSIYVITC